MEEKVKVTSGTANPVDQLQNALNRLDAALSARDLDGTMKLFAPECYWRDLLTFTWNIHTSEGPAAIRHMLEERLGSVAPAGWHVVDKPLARRSGPDVVEGFIEFETHDAHGYGYLRLKGDRIWTLLTAMKDLRGHEFHRPFGASHGEKQGEPSWAEKRAKEVAELGITRQPYVLIIGAGQNGVMLGARLRQMNVPTLVVERGDGAGDSWRKRYRTLCLHNPVWENPFPYLNLPDNWPVFASKDKFADWIEAYAKIMEVDIWTRTEARHAVYDASTRKWAVTVNRDGQDVIVRPTHLVFATGESGTRPYIPTLPGQDVFKGIQQHSATKYDVNALVGKRVVVVGSGTSAHDICGDLAQHGIDVTMIQRSPTYVVRSSSFMQYVLAPLFSQEAVDHGITAERADILRASMPLAYFFALQAPAVNKIREVDAEFYKKLGDTGFLLDFGPGDSGLFGKAVTGIYNYYIEIGTSQLIIDGKLKVASGSGIAKLVSDGLVLEDGRTIPADAIIYATGFGFMEGWIAELASDAVARKVGLVGGFGSGGPRDPAPWMGELRNMYKPTHQEGLWIQCSLIPAARFYSHFTALQLKARMEGIATPVYGLPDATPIAGGWRPQ